MIRLLVSPFAESLAVLPNAPTVIAKLPNVLLCFGQLTLLAPTLHKLFASRNLASHFHKIAFWASSVHSRLIAHSFIDHCSSFRAHVCFGGRWSTHASLVLKIIFPLLEGLMLIKTIDRLKQSLPNAAFNLQTFVPDFPNLTQNLIAYRCSMERLIFFMTRHLNKGVYKFHDPHAPPACPQMGPVAMLI